MFLHPAYNRFLMPSDFQAIKNQIDAKKVKNINCLRGCKRVRRSPGLGSSKYKNNSKMRSNLRDYKKARSEFCEVKNSEPKFSEIRKYPNVEHKVSRSLPSVNEGRNETSQSWQKLQSVSS